MADPIPNESTALGGSSSKRLSEPRLSIGSSGMPKVDFVQPEGESSPAYLYFIYLIGGCCGLAIFAGAIAVFVFTVIFLIDDEGKVSFHAFGNLSRLSIFFFRRTNFFQLPAINFDAPRPALHSSVRVLGHYWKGDMDLRLGMSQCLRLYGLTFMYV